MLPLERNRRLLEILNERGVLTTTQLAIELEVTPETIRRDLEKLEKDGALLRTHGGAVRLESARREFSVGERAAAQIVEKQAIARAALPLVESGHTVYLDPSTTVQALAALLPDRPLTVVTNSLQIPLLLAEKPEIHTVVLGGKFRVSSLSCTGASAEDSANFLRIDAAFMSCRGIDALRGLSEATEEQARLKRHLISRVNRFYLLADSTKAGVASNYFFSEVSSVDRWITDALPSPDFARVFDERQIPIDVALR